MKGQKFSNGKILKSNGPRKFCLNRTTSVPVGVTSTKTVSFLNAFSNFFESPTGCPKKYSRLTKNQTIAFGYIV